MIRTPTPSTGNNPDYWLNAWNVVKVVAVISMLIDHASVAYFNSDAEQYWLRAVGRAAAPIFLFLVGYAASYRFKKQLLWMALLISACLLPGEGIRPQNIFYTILLYRGILYFMEKKGVIIRSPMQWYIASMAWIGSMILIEYGGIGFLFALSGYLKKNRERYAKHVPDVFLFVSLVTYGAIFAFASDVAINPFIVALTLLGVFFLLSRMDTGFQGINCQSAWKYKTGRFLARQSAWLYAITMIANVWVPIWLGQHKPALL